MPGRRKKPYDYFLVYALIRKRIGRDKKLFRKFLRTISIPPSCVGITAACANFLSGMELIEKYRWPEYEGLAVFIPIAEAITELDPRETPNILCSS